MGEKLLRKREGENRKIDRLMMIQFMIIASFLVINPIISAIDNDHSLKAGEVVNKTFYLHDDQSYDNLDETDWTNTTAPTSLTLGDYDNDAEPGLEIKEGYDGTSIEEGDQVYFQDFVVTPPFASDFHIVGDCQVKIWAAMKDFNQGKRGELNVDLFHKSGQSWPTDYTKIGSGSVQENPFSNSGSWEMKTIEISNVDYTIPEGDELVIRFSVPNSSLDDIWVAYDTIDYGSNIIIPTESYIDIDSFDFYDEDWNIRNSAEYPSDEDVNLKVNVSDPIGSYDIRHPQGDENSGANITVQKPSGDMISGYFEKEMDLEQEDKATLSNWCLFRVSIPKEKITQPGVYSVNIKAWESNGVFDEINTTFDVINSRPVVHDLQVTPESQFPNKKLTFSCTATDDFGISDVRIEFWKGDKLLDNESMYYNPSNGGCNFEKSFDEEGEDYKFKISVKDDHGKWCSSEYIPFNIEIDEDVPYDIIKIAGDRQEQGEGDVLPEPFIVEVQNYNGQPYDKGCDVWFNITSEGLNGDASLSTSNPVRTDEDGRAETYLTLDSQNGENTVSAEINGGGVSRVEFKAYGTSSGFILMKRADKKLVNPGDLVDYEIYYNNTGGDDIENLWLNETLDSRLEFISDTSEVAPDIDGNKLSWNIKNVGSGTHRFTLTCSVDRNVSDGEVIVNVLDGVFIDGTGEKNTIKSNSIKIQTIAPDISISKSVNKKLVMPNSTLKYVITIANRGNGTAGEVVVEDKLDGSLIYLGDTSGSIPEVKEGGIDDQYIWNFKDVPPGTTKFILEVKVDGSVPPEQNILNYVSLNYTDLNGNHIGTARSETINITTASPGQNLPPVIEDIPDLSVRYDLDYRFNLTPYISDEDNDTDDLSISFSDDQHAVMSKKELLVMILNYPKSKNGTMDPLTISVSDGLNTNSQMIYITVSDDHPPEVWNSLPDITMSEDNSFYGFDITQHFFDIDDDPISYTFKSDYLDIMILFNGTVKFSPTLNWWGHENITFRGEDSEGAIAEDTITVKVLPVNDPPVIDDIPDQECCAGKTFRLDISEHIHDIDNEKDELVLSSDNEHIKIKGHKLLMNYPDDIKNDPVTITVSDGVCECSQEFSVNVKQPTILDKILWPWPLVSFLLLIPLGLFYREIRTDVDEVFLIYKDGSLISYLNLSDDDKENRDVMSSMLTAIQDFIQDSFSKGNWALNKLEFGDKNILIERGENVYIASVCSGNGTYLLSKRMEDVLRKIEKEYKDILSEWDGDLEKLRYTKSHLKELIRNQ